MTQFFGDDSPSNLYEYSVTELSGSIRRTIETSFDQVRVRGEISGYRGPHSSGHAYFALKDDRSRLEAVIWKGTFSRLKFRPEEGLEVIATGKITTFPGSSKYQIVIESLEPAGAGALMAMLEERKRRLAAEGLFDENRKQMLPFMPRVIGVVTSPTGAVIRDILHRIADRFPLHVVVWPVKVQGDGSGDDVAAAITGFNALDPALGIARPDVIIVARGGGSLEDLWSFNDEAVVRAAAASDIPLISAVGHETDWTLIDHAADIRAPTPTGAAEMAVPVKADIEAEIASLGARLSAVASRLMDNKRTTLRAAARALPSLDGLLALPRRRFDEAAAGLGRGLEMNTLAKRGQLDRIAGRLRPDLLAARFSDNRRRLSEAELRTDRAIDRLFTRSRSGITAADATLRGLPVRLTGDLARRRDRLANLAERAARAFDLGNQRRRNDWQQLVRMMESLSYKAVLRRGYAVIRDAHDRPLSGPGMIEPRQSLTVEFAEGRVQVMALEGEARKKPARTDKPEKPGGGNQGSLF